MRQRSMFLTVLSALSIFAWSSASHASSSSEAPRIASGEPVAECGFAPVMFVDNCTAALVHPKVVLYAAHCRTNHPQVHFTHQDGLGRSVTTEYCRTHPEYSGYQGNDFAFCVLNEPVTDIPIIPVAFGCEAEALGQGTEIVQCGFGANFGETSGFGTKRWGPNTVARLVDNGETGTVTTSPSEVVGCPGDSGGPLLTRLEDGTWRTMGMASTIDTGYDSCGRPGAVNTYAYAKSAVSWVESESGIDITPCFAADGTWEPDENCGGFYMGDENGHGTWDNGCEGTPVSGMSSTCGPAFDQEAPTVSIDSPDSESMVLEGESVDVTVSAQDNVEIASVELQLDGESVGILNEEAFEWTLEDLELGEHELIAIASDASGNTAESDPVRFTVEMLPEEDDESEDSSTSDSEGTSSSEDDESDSDNTDSTDPSEDDDTEEGDDEDETDDDPSSDEDDKDDDKDDEDDDDPKVSPSGDSGGCGCTSGNDKTPSGLIGLISLLGLSALRRRRR